MELNSLQHSCHSRFSESLTLLDWKNCTGPQCNSRNEVAQHSEICTLSVSNCHLVSSSLFGKPVKVNKSLNAIVSSRVRKPLKLAQVNQVPLAYDWCT